MKKNIYISTSIPYVNANPHTGHALELIQADTIARYFKLSGHSVYFQTGTDENAYKNVINAREKNIPTEKFVTINSNAFKELCNKLNVKYDRFIRTTEPSHKKSVLKFWKNLNPDDLYKKSYTGLYCIGCEDFYIEKDLINGLCPDHNTAPIPISEENIFFRLSKYQTEIEHIISSGKLKITPEFRKKEILNFIRNGLQDISITRPSERVGNWGIKLENDPSQTIYVWIDALINYLSGIGYGTSDTWEKYWNNENYKIHVIGKNVWKFHAVYWPALLLSADLPLPDEIFIHGFVTENNRKISKSRDNTVNPTEIIDKFGSDPVRYYLLNSISSYNDGDFSLDLFRDVYISDLANGLGNLVNRLFTLRGKSKFSYTEIKSLSIPEWYIDSLNSFDFNTCIKTLWFYIDRINKEIDDTKPWILLNENYHNKLNNLLKQWIDCLSEFTSLLEPFLPDTSTYIKSCINQETKKYKILFPKL